MSNLGELGALRAQNGPAVTFHYDPVTDGQGDIPVGDVKIPRHLFHPWWLKREPFWRLAELVYRGGEDFVNSTNPVTLYSHERERQGSYLDRRRRAIHRGHAAAIVNLKSAAIFQPQVGRGQEDDPELGDWLSDVDGCGTNADTFFADVAGWGMALGDYWVGEALPSATELADRARAEGRAITAAEAQQAKLRPRLYTLMPQSVINWGEDECGRLTFATIVEEQAQTGPFLTKEERKPRIILRVLHRDREERYAIAKNGARAMIGAPIPHDFGQVPLVRFRIRKDGRSQLEDLVRMDLAVFNYDSLAGNQVTRQAFNQLVLKVSDPAQAMAVIVGEDAVLPLKTGDDALYLAPNVDVIAAIREYINEIVDEMYAAAHLRSRLGTKSQPAVDVSGVAFAYENKAAETDLAAIAVALEELELKLGAMRALALKKDPKKFKASYPRSFDIRALQAEANEVKQLLSMPIGAKARAELVKGVVHKALPRTPAQDFKLIDAEIEKETAKAPAPAAPPGPPNQGMLPPGKGAGEDRVDRAARREGEKADE